ncbi:acylamino-acid-releasing enzyme-like [Salmo trutta]|uniref:acylamino-acid-releasing enzyme n=1 Tax=Salmo trutta TaxID=8032 RepID=UPI00113176AC|nr:acylamino-acid-releasing enzyme-like [Salmo trutta]XP_029601740.1 acylamino-acid-releasing enzyme-like [Salmo trutta]XP_029601741.1 acylamino-acid-releasing enzyme-like [Salmo trutta]
MEFLARMEPDAISTLYREISGYPTPISAFVTANDYMALLNGTSFTLCTEWSQTETVRGARLHYAQQWTLIQNYRQETDINIQPPSPCSLLHGEFLSSYSLSGDLKAVVRVTSGQVVVQQFLEVWSDRCLKKILDLSALNKHGRVYEDAQFGCLAWSTCESRLLYVAEGKRSIGESYASASSPSAGEPRAGPSEGPSEKDKSVYWEDWGEGLTSKSVPVLCVADVAKGTVTVLQGVPSHVSPGQGLWAHDGESVFFVGWWHEPFRLGLRFCSNRRSALFCLDLEGNCECLSGDTSSVSSPRLSPDGRYLVYLEGQVFGPHSQCLSMQQYDLETRKISVLVDVVNRPKKDEFAGLYEALPPRCWASDSQRVVFSSARRNWRDLFVVDRTTRRVTRMSAPEKFGSWKLLTIQNDLMVVHCSHLNEAPRLVVAFLPLAGGEGEVSWDHLGESCLLGAIVNVLDVSPTPQEENPEYSGLDFGALLVTTNHLPSRTKVPLVVFVHGGPHSQFFAEWNVTTAVLVKLGFAVLMVNYRGSTGFGQDSILSLAGNIGSQDVKDVQRAVLTALADQTAEKLLTLDPDKVVVMGGSHGGFLACHLIGQFPDFYKACAVRNPVINAATLLGTSDIVDWRYSSVGLQYSYDQLPTPEALTTMLQKSPITYAPQIKAPVLLMLGGKDRRVSPYQGLELYRSLKSRGSPVRLLLFAEDAHSLARVDTQADCFLNVVLWFQQHLYLH